MKTTRGSWLFFLLVASVIYAGLQAKNVVAEPQEQGQGIPPIATPNEGTATQQAPDRVISAGVTNEPTTHQQEQATQISPQPIGPRFPKPEETLVQLSSALTKFLEAKSQKEDMPIRLVDFFSKLAVLIGTILSCIVTYKAIRKVPWFKEHKEVIVTILTAVVLTVLFYLLSGLVTSVLYVLVAIIVLLIALVLAVAHLIKFIDEKYPEVRDNILAYFSESSAHRSTEKIVRDNIRRMEDWLSSIVSMQKLSGDFKLELTGSFVDGYDKSIFEIEPDAGVVSHWKNVDDRMLVPIKTRLSVINNGNGLTSEVVNVQAGLVVIRLQEGVEFRKFNYDGYKSLGLSLVERQAEKMKNILEQLQKWDTDIKVFNSQSI